MIVQNLSIIHNNSVQLMLTFVAVPSLYDAAISTVSCHRPFFPNC